jgi:hypothetical protein
VASTADEALSAEQFEEIRRLYQVEPRAWLELEPVYVGEGVARFTTKPGTIKGPTTVRYGEDGSLLEFAMEVERLDAETPVEGPNSLFLFMYGRPVPGSPGSFSIAGWSNECATLEVGGEGFTLAAAQRSSVIANAGDAGATFKPYRTIARFAESARRHYWVAPLVNFVVDFRQIAVPLQDHPLRTRATAPLEARGSDGYVGFIHESGYRAGNALIPFLCEHELAFIEPLPDYAERRARVESGESLVTAVAVGRLPDSFDLEAADWFPADLVTMLGLSSGRSVAVPFVEIRGLAGELIARMHVRIGDAGLSRGTALIDEKFIGSTGALLTSFLVSEFRDEVWFRVMLKHLLLAYSAGGTVEDRLSHLFRAVEGACVGLRLNRSRPLEIEDNLRQGVERTIAELIERIEEIQKGASESDRARLAQLLNRVREIVANRPSFPTQLLALVETVGLPDADWLADFTFRVKNPRRDGRPRSQSNWASAAGAYRNRIFHSAFIDFDTFDPDNAFAFIGHLSDVLARVVFHLIGFVGKYQPPCGNAGMKTYETPAWAKPERLSAEVFRYVD